MPLTPVQRTLRTCLILCALAVALTGICAWGCSSHTYAHGPLAPETPSDRQTTVWASGAYLGVLLFVISSSTLMLTISSMRRHQRTLRKAAMERAMQAAMDDKELPEIRPN